MLGGVFTSTGQEKAFGGFRNGPTDTMPDNNGNLKKQGVYIPNQPDWWQQYEYDNLNRISWVREIASNQELWKQTYVYDLYGNRRIDTGLTSGFGINSLGTEVETATNRLYASGDLALPEPSRKIRYDGAGNQAKDYYSVTGKNYDRTYDAENRMISATRIGFSASIYTYNADGQRVRRKVDGVETWQIYGLDGELLAEYPFNGAKTSPQKEYGYRNGQLLVTAAVGADWDSPPVLNDNPLVVGQTTVQSRHITELRTAINSLRTHLEMSPFVWQQPAEPGDWIKADPILEMRTALDQALGAPPPPGYSAGLSQNLPVLAIHIQELRNRVLAAWVSASSLEINWLVADHLGTPRMVIGKTGALGTVKRHDYLPFGEELVDGVGGRTLDQGYGGDTIRQKFTSYERDNETELDFAQARYYSSRQGRFTSVDPFMGSARQANPQSWNRYSYVLNRPLSLIDPTGMGDCTPQSPCQEVSLEEANQSNGVGLIQETVTINISDQTPLETTNPSMIVSLTHGAGQVASDTVVGAGMSVYNTIFGTANMVNAPIDYGLSFFTSFQFGQADLYHASTPGEQGAMYGMMIGGFMVGGVGGIRAASASGEFYSVAYQTQLRATSYPGVSRAGHFQEANEALLTAMEGDAAFASSMQHTGVNLQRSITGLAPRTSPAGWTWHHAQNPGVMQLVPRSQHTAGSIFWQALHPTGRGGYSIWGQ